MNKDKIIEKMAEAIYMLDPRPPWMTWEKLMTAVTDGSPLASYELSLARTRAKTARNALIDTLPDIEYLTLPNMDRDGFATGGTFTTNDGEDLYRDLKDMRDKGEE